MKIVDTPIAGLKVVKPVPYRDDRGVFVRVFCAHELQPLLGHRQIVQINQSSGTRAGTVRGLHFQHPPHAEMKMIRCIRGRIWDVAVDLRAGSPTFLQSYGRELTADNTEMLVIPEGFAHGVQTLEPGSELTYLVTAPYHPPSEAGLRPDDPRLAINWPLLPQNLSSRDLSHPLLDADFPGLTL